jgi:hypothetical protein
MLTSRFVTGALTAAAIVFAVTFSMTAAVSAEQTPSAAGAQEIRLLASLNGCIQTRFQEIDFKFGIRRVIKPGETPHRFEPETVREISAVRELEDAGLRVVLYLTGRQVLRDKPPLAGLSNQMAWELIKGPVLITQAPTGSVLPAPASMDLWDDSRRAMQSFGQTDSREFALAGWNFVARPVRAEPMCLNCHREETAAGNPLKVGDPIGVVLYGYTANR